MNKKALRVKFINERLGLTSKEYKKRNQAIQANFLNAFFDLDPKLVHSYLPLLAKGEVNTLPIIDWFRKKGSEVAIPKSNFNTAEMRHYLYDERTILKENPWGISEPVAGKQVSVQQIDLVLVPLLIFDQLGHRVGYGKGFYDRFLIQCRQDTLKIGLSLFAPVDRITDVDRYDVKLDAVVTPQQVFRFN